MMDEFAMSAALAPKPALLAALAAEGNLGRAAERLGIPQPTASRWLAALSELVGTPVTHTEGRGIRLTMAGEHLAEAAETALVALRAGCGRLAADADPEHGQVVLAFLHTMGELRVPELLRTFRGEHPSVRFTLLQGSHEQVLDRLRRGEADLALTSPPPAGEEFRYAVVDEQPLTITVSSDHRLANRRRVRLAEFADEPFVGIKVGYGLRQITDELCREAGISPTLAFEGAEVDTMRWLVAAGLGVALLPMSERDLPTGVVELSLAPRSCRRISMAWPARRPMSPAVRMFRDYALGSLPDSAIRSAQRRSTPASRQ